MRYFIKCLLSRDIPHWQPPPWFLDSRNWIPASFSGTLVSIFQLLVGFRIPWSVFRIPKPRMSDSTSKISRNPDFPFMGRLKMNACYSWKALRVGYFLACVHDAINPLLSSSCYLFCKLWINSRFRRPNDELNDFKHVQYIKTFYWIFPLND